MIRLSAALVAVAIGLLAGGCATSKLLFVYIAIVVSGVALVVLLIGVVLKREEIFGERKGLVPAAAGASPAIPARVGASRGAGNGSAAAWRAEAVPPSVLQDRPVPGDQAAAGFGAGFGETSPDVATRAEPAVSAPSWGKPPADAHPPWWLPARDEAAGETTSFDWLGKSAGATGPGATPPSAASPSATPDSNAALDDDDDWPTRYSWLDDEADEADETAGPVVGEPATRQSAAEPATAEHAATEPATAEPVTAETGAGELADGGADPEEPAGAAAPDTAPTVTARPGATTTPEAAETGPAAAEAAETGAAATEAAETDTVPAEAAPAEEVPIDAVPIDAGETSEVPAAAADTVAAPTDGGDPPAKADVTEPASGVESSPADAAEPSSAWQDPVSGTTLVAVVRGVPRYHEPECVLIRFMPEADLQKLTVPEAQATGCTPCAVCQSDE